MLCIQNLKCKCIAKCSKMSKILEVELMVLFTVSDNLTAESTYVPTLQEVSANITEVCRTHGWMSVQLLTLSVTVLSIINVNKKNCLTIINEAAESVESEFYI